MYEIYRSELVDLMNHTKSKNKPKLFVKTDASGSVYVENGTVTEPLNSPVELDKALESGMAIRHVAATLMNSESSRSHLVQIIFIEVRPRRIVVPRFVLLVRPTIVCAISSFLLATTDVGTRPPTSSRKFPPPASSRWLILPEVNGQTRPVQAEIRWRRPSRSTSRCRYAPGRLGCSGFQFCRAPRDVTCFCCGSHLGFGKCDFSAHDRESPCTVP